MLNFQIIAAVAVAIILYLLEAIGVFTLSKRLGLKGAALSFIPYANSYALGNLAGNCPDGAGNLKPSLKKTLLALRVASSALIIVAALVAGLTFEHLFALYEADNLGAINERGQLALLFIIVLIMLIALAVMMIYIVFRYIALWRVFSFISKNNAALLLVFSIIIPELAPIFIFAIRNKAVSNDMFTLSA